jgi:tRNA (cmo5U34)-methyltransferase
MQPAPVNHFTQEHASRYDQNFANLAPMNAALHLLIKALLLDLPAQARVLCVGAGTGAELLVLAQEFPQWHFTAVEPSKPMLDICRQRAEAAEIASRCTFHQGYLDSLPAAAPFDAATALLVSHFLMEREARRQFFAHIAARLRPGALLVNSDLTSDMDTASYRSLREVWRRMFRFAGIPNADSACAAHGTSVALLPPFEMEQLLQESGFQEPTLFFQTLLIHAWYSQRA